MQATVHVGGMDSDAGQGICLPHCPLCLPRGPAGRVPQHGLLGGRGVSPNLPTYSTRSKWTPGPPGHLILRFVTHPDQTRAGLQPQPFLGPLGQLLPCQLSEPTLCRRSNVRVPCQCRVLCQSIPPASAQLRGVRCFLKEMWDLLWSPRGTQERAIQALLSRPQPV